MSLLAALLERGDPVERRTIRDDQLWNSWARGEDFGATAESEAGVRVTRITSLGLASVWACVSLIADSVATLPVEAYTIDSERERTAASDQPEWLQTPNPEQTRVDWIFNQVASLLLDGNAFVYTIRDKFGDVVTAWILDPNWVQVRREFGPNGQLQIVYYVMVAKGQQSPVGPFRVPAGPDMFHVMAFQSNSGYPRGLAPLEVARQLFGGAIASQHAGSRFFGHGMNASGVLEVPDTLSDVQAKQLKEDFSRAAGGWRKWGLPPVLTGGAAWKQIQISPEQAQFLEHRQFTTEDIARFFRVPPFMVGVLAKTTSWGTGIEQQGIGYVTYTLRPWIERLEEAWSRYMMMARPGVRIGFDVGGLLRGDTTTRAQWYNLGRFGGWLSANDVRVKEGMAKIPDGDIYLVPTNMTAPGNLDPSAVPLGAVTAPTQPVASVDEPNPESDVTR